MYVYFLETHYKQKHNKCKILEEKDTWIISEYDKELN